MEKPPNKKTAGDAAYEITKAAISAIPVASGPVAALFENIFTAPLEKRKHTWLEELADAITKLQRKVDGLTPEALAKNEVFVTVALQASQIALRNHQKEKLDALRNAVVNSALPNSPQEDQQIIFLRLLDQLTSWHLRILAVLDGPEEWMSRNGVTNPGWGMGGVATVLQHCLPQLRGQRDFYDQLVRDLQAAGLIGHGEYLHATMTGHGMVASRTTPIGREFMRFVSQPE
jgi:hypothetical protein